MIVKIGMGHIILTVRLFRIICLMKQLNSNKQTFIQHKKYKKIHNNEYVVVCIQLVKKKH